LPEGCFWRKAAVHRKIRARIDGKSYAYWKCVFPGASVSAETGGQEAAKIDGRIDSG